MSKHTGAPGETPGVQTYIPREYPLQVERTVEGETYYSKGWHAARDFASATNAFIDENYGKDARQGITAEHVRYDVWRVLPAVPDECAGVAFWFIPGQLGTPGAFPVTLVYS